MSHLGYKLKDILLKSVGIFHFTLIHAHAKITMVYIHKQKERNKHSGKSRYMLKQRGVKLFSCPYPLKIQAPGGIDLMTYSTTSKRSTTSYVSSLNLNGVFT